MESSKPKEIPSQSKTRLFWRKVGKKINRNSLHLLVIVCLLALIGLSMFDSIFITIDPGERGVFFKLFDGGTVENEVLGEGLHVISPWNRIYKYKIRQQIVTNCIHVLCTEGMSMEIELAVRFWPRIDSLGVIHKYLGPDYPSTVIIPEVASSVRKIMAQYDPHDIYAMKRDSVEERVLMDTKTEFGSLNILIDDIMIKDIILPSNVEASIEDKMIAEQRYLAYEFILKTEGEEAKRKLIEARGIKLFEDSSGISMLKWKGLEATRDISKSDNSKVVIIGTDGEGGGMPVILGGD